MVHRMALSVLIALGPCTAYAQSGTLDDLHFLLGEWRAVDRPAGETGMSTFTLTLQGHAIVRSNEAIYAATADRAASRHDDLLVIYRENESLKADYYDSEAHVIRYAVEARGNEATFVSDAHAPGPRYRLTYRLGTDGVLAGSFEIASPQTPDAFKPYLTWKARKP